MPQTRRTSEHQAPETEEREVRADDPRLSPDTNARLTEELRAVVGADRVRVPRERPRAAHGDRPIRQSDERFSEMVEEFRAEPRGGVGEVLSPGHNERTMEAGADPAGAGAEQSTAFTPTAEPSRPGGDGATPDYIVWATAAGLAIVSLVVPPLQGTGWMWLLPAVMLPLLAGWVAMQAVMVNRGDAVQITSKKPLVVVVLGTAIAVAVFCALVAIAFQH